MLRYDLAQLSTSLGNASATAQRYVDSRATRCADRTPAQVFVREWPAQVSRGRWVIFFQSGGQCAEASFCHLRQFGYPWLFSSSLLPPTLPSTPAADHPPIGNLAESALSPFEEDNPAFWDFNHVFVPYCSQDAGLLDGVERFGGRYFGGGGAIAQVAIDTVLQRAVPDATGQRPAPSSPVQRVVIAGSSAGGITVQIHTRLAYDAYPWVPLAALADSSSFFDYRGAMSNADGVEVLMAQAARWLPVCQWSTSNRTSGEGDADDIPCCLTSSCVLSRWFPREVPLLVVASRFDVFEFAQFATTVPTLDVGRERLLGASSEKLTTTALAPVAAMAGYGAFRRSAIVALADEPGSRMSYVIPSCFQHEFIDPYNHPSVGNNTAQMELASFTNVNVRSQWTSVLVGPPSGRVAIADAVALWADRDAANAGGTTVRLEDMCTSASCNPTCPEVVHVTSGTPHVEFSDTASALVTIVAAVAVAASPLLMFAVCAWVALFGQYHKHFVARMESAEPDLDSELDVAAGRPRRADVPVREARTLVRKGSSLSGLPPITFLCKDVRCVVTNTNSNSTPAPGGTGGAGRSGGAGAAAATAPSSGTAATGTSGVRTSGGTASSNGGGGGGAGASGSAAGGDKVLVNGVSFFANPGEVVAIMGKSGSGKTSLLRALVDRLPPGARRYGELWANGVEMRDPAFGAVIAPRVAFVQQTSGGFVPTLTVRLNLVFAAHLIMRDESWAEREQRVDDVIRVVGLASAAETLVGSDKGHGGISGGQRRLLSVAVALLSRPSVLIMDEVTSGLDSDSTRALVSVLRSLAVDTGIAVCLTAHQPSAEVFSLFHRCMVLVPGGNVAYFGSTASDDVADFLEHALKGYLWLTDDGMDASDNVADFLIDCANDMPDLLVKYYREQVAPSVTHDIADAIAHSVGAGVVAGAGAGAGPTPLGAPGRMQSAAAVGTVTATGRFSAPDGGPVIRVDSDEPPQLPAPLPSPVKGKPSTSAQQTRQATMRTLNTAADADTAVAEAAARARASARGGAARSSWSCLPQPLRKALRALRLRFVALAVLEGRILLSSSLWDTYGANVVTLFCVFAYGTVFYRVSSPVAVVSVFFTTMMFVPQAHVGGLSSDVYFRVDQLRADLNNAALSSATWIWHTRIRTIASAVVTLAIGLTFDMFMVLPSRHFTLERVAKLSIAAGLMNVFLALAFSGIVLRSRTALGAESLVTAFLAMLSATAGFMFPNTSDSPVYIRVALHLNPAFYGLGAVVDALLRDVVLECDYDDVVRCLDRQGVVVQLFFGLDGISFDLGVAAMLVLMAVAAVATSRSGLVNKAADREAVVE